MEEERTYKMEYKAELECLHPGAVIITSGGESLMIQCQTKGQVGNVQGKLVFEKTETAGELGLKSTSNPAKRTAPNLTYQLSLEP